MTEPSILSVHDPDACWRAVLARDRGQDGRFVTGVLTTGIYCRPSCPARHPDRANVRFFRDGREARAAGLRACLRCRPDAVARDEAAVLEAIATIQASEHPISLTLLAASAGYSPSHFQRLFAARTGFSPAAYARALRAERAVDALSRGAAVSEAIYEAGYSGPSRFYAEAGERLGMAPSVWRDGGRGARIWWSVVETSLGPMLVALTERGVCRLAFGEGEADLASRFPHAELVKGAGDFSERLTEVIAAVERPGQGGAIPLDVQGSAFQQAVWQALRAIPPGETRSYAQLAAAAGHPRAVRAAGSANGANPVAVLIPCHRVVRSDGSLGGYAWGEEIKRELLSREASERER